MAAQATHRLVVSLWFVARVWRRLCCAEKQTRVCVCAKDENGLIDTFELEVAVRSFNPQVTNVDQGMQRGYR